MSCSATIVIVAEGGADGDELVRRSVRRLGQLEQRWSRFRDDSEISGLNSARGDARRVSADTARLVESLVQAWRATDGAFDPTLLGTLVELGYAASRDDSSLVGSPAAGTAPQGQPDLVTVDRAAGIVQLPVGTTLDPGGLGKGLAADIVTAEAMQAGALGALVEIGGDVRVVGESPAGNAWPISVAAIGSDVPAAIVDVTDGGIATSTPRLRTWSTDGQHRHHLIDPTTLRPSTADVISCTVIAGTAAWAEAFTKLAFTLDLETALSRLDALSLAASITTSAGTFATPLWKGLSR